MEFIASLRYFSLGNITFTDQFGTTIRDFKPNEFAFDVVYSRKLSDNFSAGLAARYIYSNLTGGTSVGGADTKPGQSAAADLSIYYIYVYQCIVVYVPHQHRSSFLEIFSWSYLDALLVLAG